MMRQLARNYVVKHDFKSVLNTCVEEEWDKVSKANCKKKKAKNKNTKYEVKKIDRCVH